MNKAHRLGQKAPLLGFQPSQALTSESAVRTLYQPACSADGPSPTTDAARGLWSA